MVLFTPTKVLRFACAEDLPLQMRRRSLSEARHFSFALVILTRHSRWSVKSTNRHTTDSELLTNSNFDLSGNVPNDVASIVILFAKIAISPAQFSNPPKSRKCSVAELAGAYRTRPPPASFTSLHLRLFGVLFAI